MTINQQDFITPITGNVVIQNNGARLVLQANADLNTLFEGDESFKLVLRKGSNTGPVVATTAVIIVRDTSNTITYNSLVESAGTIGEGDTVTFVLNTTNLGPNNTVYYNTTGNATSSLFAAGNTGSFITTGNAYTLSLATAATIPDNQTRFFQLQIREGSLSGPVKITSNVVTVVDALQAFVTATGGFLTIEDGYKIHTFTSSNTFAILGLGLPINRTLEYLVVAGGGGGGVGSGNPFDLAGGGGGAGGFRTGNLSIIPNYQGNNSIIVGGGATTLSITNTAGNKGSNSSIFSEIFATGGGGGGVGYQTPGKGGAPGGSGGGRGGDNRWPPAGLGNDPPTIPPQGNPGGEGMENGNANAAGGGGGAGQNGGNATGGWAGGFGGNGLPITWVSAQFGISGPAPGRWFAGGGGGSGYYGIGVGGIGGGGRGGITTAPTTNSIAGTVNTGGGGGGGAGTPAPTDFGGGGGSGIVVVRYPYTVKTFSITDDAFQPGAIVQGANITYALTTVNVSNNSVLYYTTSGNVTTSDFFGGNTGSFTVVAANATFGLSIANNIVSGGATKAFALQLREGSTSGPVVASANTVTVYSQDPSNFISATGGTPVQDGIYTLRVFTSSDNFNVTSVGAFNKVEYLIVAGGGAGAVSKTTNHGGAGGGAGGLITGETTVVAQPYLANIGGGGTSAPFAGAPQGDYVSGSGGNSHIFSHIAVGGGGAVENISIPQQNTGRGGGGSGGGGNGGMSLTMYGGLGISGQGFPGGTQPERNPGYNRGAGGGGAGEAGQGGANTQARGGNGRPISWIPASYGVVGPTPGRWFAGGGGSGGANQSSQNEPSVPAVGGAGGGGVGGRGNPGPAQQGFAGNVNTGGGGGGGGANPSALLGGSGGSGIIVIRYIKP